jgi:hypothetical protein
MASTQNVSSASKKPRKRAAHEKSKQGCGNCKTRRVRCDEKSPECGNCHKAHIACSYAAGGASMQSSHERAVTCGSTVTPRCSNNELILGMINRGLSSSASGQEYQLSLPDLEIVFRFQNRTALSMGPRRLAYKTESIKLVAQNPFLCHTVLTCTAMHDR